MSLPSIVIEDLVRRALLEDLGHGHDATSEALIQPDHRGRLVMRARTKGILAGIDIAACAFRLFDGGLKISNHLEDGAFLKKGDHILSVEGNARSILGAERTALNFLSHLSGIATQTQEYVKTVSGTKAAIACTRKTLPGLRAVQKYAVRMGGGKNHRFGLDDAILIKDNHISLCGGISQAIAQARAQAGHMIKIEIEVDDLAQLEAALSFGIDAVLLDNMPPEILSKAVEITQGRTLLEASGGITLETVRAIAETGIDIISIGALTHSATALDIGLDMDV